MSKRTPPDPLDALRLVQQSSMMMVEAQGIIAMRLWGMAGVWNVTSGENRRMVEEKSSAARASVTAAQTAILRGASPVEAGLAALKPVRDTTRANAKRLQKRGLKGA